MNPQEQENLLERAARLIQANERSFVVEMDAATLAAFISQLQLAFRHPQNVGYSRNIIESMTRSLIRRLDPEEGDVYRLMMMGFDPSFDHSFDDSKAKIIDGFKDC